MPIPPSFPPFPLPHINVTDVSIVERVWTQLCDGSIVLCQGLSGQNTVGWSGGCQQKPTVTPVKENLSFSQYLSTLWRHLGEL